MRRILLACALSGCSTEFYDSMAAGVGNWGLFQEPINACYSTDAGAIAAVDGGLSLRPNAGGSLLSNHLIAQHRLNDAGVSSTVFLLVDVVIVADPYNWLTYPQTGPEISVQNTRQIADGGFITQTMGIQYVANPWDSKWNVWKESSPGVASWSAISGPALSPNEKYTLAVGADFATGEYTASVVCSAATCTVHPVAGVAIADESKWDEAALWVTLEAENLWQSACGGSGAQVLKAEVLYDNVLVGAE